VIHAYNPITQEGEAGGSQFKTKMSYTMTLCLKKNKQERERKRKKIQISGLYPDLQLEFLKLGPRNLLFLATWLILIHSKIWKLLLERD
jgi:hypothetical protein